jgi:bifunctional ADP-heptose synthase (sugar kinase/adenylyltransferase)
MNEQVKKQILIAGDVMLDRYWFGEVNRISPEAPVPIVRVERREERLGGAANVALNAVALGVNAGLMGIIGDDEAGNSIENLLKKPVFPVTSAAISRYQRSSNYV